MPHVIPKKCMPYAAVIFEEPQFAYDVAKEYKEHVDSVRRDRSLEEFLEARLVKLIITHISTFPILSCWSMTATRTCAWSIWRQLPIPHCITVWVWVRLEPLGLESWMWMHGRPNPRCSSGLPFASIWKHSCKLNIFSLPLVRSRIQSMCKTVKTLHSFGKFSQCIQERTISKDGMDQAKWAVPRHRGSTTPKSMSGLTRPKFKIQGIWLHGVLLKLWVLDPRCPADASTVLETMTRSIEQVVLLCHDKGFPLPDELLCWVLWCNYSAHVTHVTHVSQQKSPYTFFALIMQQHEEWTPN